MESFDLTFHPSHGLAGLLVIFYAWSRFNTPKSVRSQTSRFQYLASGGTYVLSCVGLWIGLTLAIQNNPQWLTILHPASADGMKIEGLEAPLIAALMLTTLLGSVPILQQLDARILMFFHKIGAIPFGAVRWAQRMRDARFEMPERLLEETRKYIHDTPDVPDVLLEEISGDENGAPQQYHFTCVLSLYISLNRHGSLPRFAADFPEDIDAFEKRMKSYFSQCVSYFTVAAQLTSQQLAPIPDSGKRFLALSKEAHDDVRLMLARLLLFSSNREAQIAEKLKSLGFRIEPQKGIAFPLNLLALDWICVVVLFSIAILSAPPTSGDATTRRLTIGLMVALNHCVAAAFAVLPKQLWGFANREPEQERPVLAYLMSGLFTLTVVLALSAIVYAVRLGSPHSESLLPFAAQCKWLTLSTVLAILLAAACDDYVLAERDPRWLRAAECIGVGGSMAIIGYLVARWIAPDLQAMHWIARPRPVIPVVLSALIGGLFGATIPHWYRRTMRKLDRNRKPPASAPLHFVPNTAPTENFDANAARRVQR